MMKLEGIYETFNLHRPEDFTGHSLSVSDIVVLHEGGKDTAHYVDAIGFEEVPAFFKQEPDRFRYYITEDATRHGTYPYMDETDQTHFTSQLHKYEQGAITAYGYLEYSKPLTPEQEKAYDQLKDLSDKVELGEYRGFPMTLWVSDSGFSQKLQITLKHELSHSLEPGSDPSGNITRIDNALDSMKENLQKHQAELANLLQQTEDAKVEVKRPFPQEAELSEKSNRLNVLNVALNIGGKDAPKDRERQRHDGKTSIKRLLRRMGVESAASASAPKKENDLEVAI